ncbi:PocR ligand-binding domain-containing protein [Clostridium grantii]|uniref:histidine kinase n=1 Tax=Clostridium grantii DSM 8605 TaxID=1121316 RepID=A0A1M5TTB8_9CLOT|nr:PocR ligand-binding domain-containing protein [Clostridium grantii]SHH53643.1 Histidine kinase-, DNA gyrase B-, and HSP90-like ATPase [Clostridium grantii DSM 8605]
MENKNGNENSQSKPVKQYFEWGDIKWIQENNDLKKSKFLIGHVTLLPGQNQEEHNHSGDEQLIYVVSGQGEQWLNDRYNSLLPGRIYKTPPFAKHEVQNTGKSPLEMIIVYNIDKYDINQLIPAENILDNFYLEDPAKIIDVERLQKIQDKFSEDSYLGIVIKDIKGNLLTTPSNIPEFCKIKEKNMEKCFINKEFDKNDIVETTVYDCCYDVKRIMAPIFLGEKLVGTITCGPVIIKNPNPEVEEKIIKEYKEDGDQLLKAYNSLRRVSREQLYAIIETLRTMSNSIVETSVINFINKERQERTFQILKEAETRSKLERTLVETKMKVIQSQMSPHFLFNTLSVIGQLAYMNGAKEAAETTFALSSLLRTTLTKSLEFVSVNEELKYIKDYLFIQNKRFKDFIKTDIDIEDKVKDVTIPFLTLQLFVENAIVHGFKNMQKQCELKIKGEFLEDRIKLSVKDNGVGIPKERLDNISEEIIKSSGEGIGIGLTSLKSRLEYYYGKNFVFEIKSEYGNGTEVILILPINRKKEVK